MRKPKHSTISEEDRQKEYKKDPFKKLAEQDGVVIKGWTRRRGR